MPITANILDRTFRIRYQGATGTGFTVDIEDQRYLVTAKHVVDSLQDGEMVEFFNQDSWIPVEMRLVGHGEGDVDVSVLEPGYLFGGGEKCHYTMDGTALSGEVYFLGFPYGLHMSPIGEFGKENFFLSIPLVKRAIISAFPSTIGNPMLLDGHNNPGFSGGPVIRVDSSGAMFVIGVISGFKSELQRVSDKDSNPTTNFFQINTGIIVAYDIRHVLAIINSQSA